MWNEDSLVRLTTDSISDSNKHQISNFDGVIADCTSVLEVEPDNVKALIRRAQAFEGVERYRFALQDCKAVLMMGQDKIGKTNYDLCNGLQHRLQRTVDQLKKMG